MPSAANGNPGAVLSPSSVPASSSGAKVLAALPESRPPSPPAGAQGDEGDEQLRVETVLSTGDGDRLWRAVIAELKGQRRDLLAMALANGRVLEVAPGAVRLGFEPAEAMFRSQAERGLKEAEAALLGVMGRPTRIILEAVTADAAKRSVAQEDGARERVREERVLRESREHAAVLAAMRILGGSVEQIRALEPEADVGFVPAPDEAEESSRDEP